MSNLNNISQNNIITGERIAETCDLIFAANFSKEFLDQKVNKDYKVISNDELYTGFKLSKFSIKEGDSIYCNSSYLENLFYYLKNVKSLKNVTLVSGQSDRPITKKIFNQKPDCIKLWFSVNVDYLNDNLVPIPLGIANNYSPKNIRLNNFEKFNSLSQKKEEKLYINLQKNTNTEERSTSIDVLKNKNWVVFKEPNMKIDDYLGDLNKYKFVLCPWGNGFDTHRLWETLYAGSIPVTKKHTTYVSYKELPIIFIDSFEDLNLEYLKNKSREYESKNFIELDLNYWKNLINPTSKSQINNPLEIKIEERPVFEYIYWKNLYFISRLRSKNKKIKYFVKKLKNLIYRS